MADEISVLIVDDSALMRNLISHMVEDTPGLTVAEKAMNGRFALQKIPRVNPDVICLDLEMPEMNGIEFLKERKKQGIEIPVVILSSVASRGAEITMEALSLGASDFIQKPSGAVSEDIHVVKDTLVSKLLGYGGAFRKSQGKKVPVPSAPSAVPSAPSAPSKSSKSESPVSTAKSSDVDSYFKLAAQAPTGPAQPPVRARIRLTRKL